MSGVSDRAAWLPGPATTCQHYETVPGRPYRMVLLGAPGVGKGTQAELLCATLHTCHLSTGDVFRAAKCTDPDRLSPAMTVALEYMNQGRLVPDETVIDMVRERVTCVQCPFGFLLDGFPRTVQQAEALDQMLSGSGVKLDAVLDYELPIDEVVARLSGRRTCGECKTTFHLQHKPPRQDGICDKCGGELYQRDDDRPESIRVRLKAYADSTAPLTDYYRARGVLRTISAEGAPEKVFERTQAVLV